MGVALRFAEGVVVHFAVCVAVCCSVLQCFAVRCSALQHVVVRYIVLWCLVWQISEKVPSGCCSVV